MGHLCARFTRLLLLQLNLLIMVFAGGALVLAARLKWDPTVYVPARELFPQEYHVLSATLPLAALAAILLANVILLALHCPHTLTRRVLLIIYSTCTFVLVTCEVAIGVWVTARVQQWTDSQQAKVLGRVLRVGDRVQSLLEDLAYFHPLPQKISNIMQEAEADAPRNLRAMIITSGVAVGLQLAAALLTLIVIFTAHGRPRVRAHSRVSSLSETGTTTTPISFSLRKAEQTPLRAVYKQGRLVMV